MALLGFCKRVKRLVTIDSTLGLIGGVDAHTRACYTSRHSSASSSVMTCKDPDTAVPFVTSVSNPLLIPEHVEYLIIIYERLQKQHIKDQWVKD